jgi:multisubunit Na+/H+ antiporter MnhG subunit
VSERADPLMFATVTGMIVVGVIVVADLVVDGKLDPTLLALVVAIFAPLVPALIARAQYRHRDRKNGNGDHA